MTCVILTEITITFNCYGVTATQLTTLVPLYCCDNVALNMTVIAAETFR